MNKTFLVAGLGNPEGKYFNTYHNVGFITVEKLTADFQKKGNVLISKTDNAVIIKPLTYMNRSGEAVVAISRKLKIPPEQIIVVYDDVEIDSGNIRVRFGGSSGGHNGIKSITQLLGTDKFYRVRIGIKPLKPVANLANYVLSKIKDINTLGFTHAEEAIHDIMQGVALELIQQKFNKTNQQ